MSYLKCPETLEGLQDPVFKGPCEPLLKMTIAILEKRPVDDCLGDNHATVWHSAWEHLSRIGAAQIQLCSSDHL